MTRTSCRVIAGLGFILIVVCANRLRTQSEPTMLVVTVAPLVLIGLAAAGERLDTSLGARRAAVLRCAAATLATLAVLAVTGAESSSPLLLLVALPLVMIGARFGPAAAMYAWLATSFAVVGWSAAQWKGAAEPILEPVVTLAVAGLSSLAVGWVSQHLAERALDFELATAEANGRTALATKILQASAELAAHDRSSTQVLLDWAENIVDAPAISPKPADAALDRDLALQAIEADGFAVVQVDGDGMCRLGLSVGGPRSDVLLLTTEKHPTGLEVEAIELLVLLCRGLAVGADTTPPLVEARTAAAPRQRRTSWKERRPRSATVIEKQDRPYGPVSEVSGFYALLESGADNLVEAMFGDDASDQSVAAVGEPLPIYGRDSETSS